MKNNLNDNLLTENILAEVHKLNSILTQQRVEEGLKIFKNGMVRDYYQKENKRLHPNSIYSKRLKRNKESKNSDNITDSSIHELTSKEHSKISLSTSEDSPMKEFLKSSIQRCRILPKTYKKINLNKMTVAKSTKPKPFSLSKSNYSRNRTKDQTHKQFKARKMPDMSIPFVVYKGEGTLTQFKDFDLATQRKDDLLQAQEEEIEMKTPVKY